MEEMEGRCSPSPSRRSPIFDAEIAEYVKQAKAIGRCRRSPTAAGSSIDAKPVKQALATWVNKWQFQYTNYLQTSIGDARRAARLHEADQRGPLQARWSRTTPRRCSRR